MKKFYYFVLFLALNFGGLAFGSYLMNDGPTSDWYSELNKAPWTPPGFVFGIAWTIIMLCFSWYLTELIDRFKSKNNFLWGLFAIHFVLNVGWNWVFFNQHLILLGFVVITLLTILIFYYFIKFNSKSMKLTRFLILPYMLWLLVASSLNAYILFMN